MTKLKFSKLPDDTKIQILKTNTNKDITKNYSSSGGTLNKLRLELNCPNPHDYRAATRKHQINEDYFSTVNTEEKAYILGFLAADGNVNPNKYGCEIRIVLHPQDVNILEKINKAWDSTYFVKDHKLGKHSGYSGSNKLQKKLSIVSGKFQTDLFKYGIVPAKSKILRFPTNLSRDLHRHYLRGFLDGDGYINQEAFGWTTNENMANDIQGVCMSHGFNELRRYKHTITESHTVRGSQHHMDIIKWMFKDATIYLDRKYEKYKEFWENRVYRKPCRPSYPTVVKHIPCAREALPPGLGSMP